MTSSSEKFSTYELVDQNRQPSGQSRMRRRSHSTTTHNSTPKTNYDPLFTPPPLLHLNDAATRKKTSKLPTSNQLRFSYIDSKFKFLCRSLQKLEPP